MSEQIHPICTLLQMQWHKAMAGRNGCPLFREGSPSSLRCKFSCKAKAYLALLSTDIAQHEVLWGGINLQILDVQICDRLHHDLSRIKVCKSKYC